jgi:hypothetical protein
VSLLFPEQFLLYLFIDIFFNPFLIPRPGWGSTSRLPFDIVPLGSQDDGCWIYHAPTTYLGDEHMLCILDRGRSVTVLTVTELIFVRSLRLTIFL